MRSYKENTTLVKMLHYGSQYQEVSDYEIQEEYEKLKEECTDEIIKSVHDAFHPKNPEDIIEYFVPEVPDCRTIKEYEDVIKLWIIAGNRERFKLKLIPDILGDE